MRSGEAGVRVRGIVGEWWVRMRVKVRVSTMGMGIVGRYR